MNEIKLNREQEKNMLSVHGTWENYLRVSRISILDAFDIYKSNVQYGIEIESQDEHDSIINWYKKVLNLDKNAFIDIPHNIKKYI
jgi:hypothetical protein